MDTFVRALIGIIALIHLLFVYLEMFLWTKPAGLKIFRRTSQQAMDSASLAANQGLYNGFLATGLAWSLIHSDPKFAMELQVFFLGCVMVAGIFGAITVTKKIFLIQALPAMTALVLLIAGH